MPKSSKIRWRDKDVKELERVVRNFNNKIRRVAKKDPNAVEFLPDKISVKSLKGSIATRSDFKKELNSLKRFSKRGAESLVTTPTGLTLSQYEIGEAKEKTRIVNIKRALERKKLDVSERTGTMGQVSSQNLRPKAFNLNKSQKEWEKFVKSLERETSSRFKIEQLEKYKENYLDAIDKFLGEAGEELRQLVETIDIETLFKNSIETPTLSIGFTSDPLDVDTIATRALLDWKEVL